jgi:hypothetical protein
MENRYLKAIEDSGYKVSAEESMYFVSIKSLFYEI